MATDSSAIDAAIVAALQADAALASLMPDGVYMDIAPPGLQRYVIVSLVIAEDRATFEGRAIEDCLYLVKAVMLTTTSTTGEADSIDASDSGLVRSAMLTMHPRASTKSMSSGM